MRSGVLLAMLSSLVFSVVNVLVKEVSVTIPPAEISFFRGLLGTVFLLIWMRYSRVRLSTKGIPMLALRGILGALYLITYFYAIANMPLSDASILAHMSPVFTLVLSAWFLKEKIPRHTWWKIPIIFAGALILIQPFSYGTYTLAGGIGLTSALLSAAAGISIRYLSSRHHSYEIVFYFLAASALVSVPLMANHFVIPDLKEGLYLAAIAMISLLGQLFLTKAFTHEKAIVVEITRYIGIVYNVAWGYLLWSEKPGIAAVTGGIMIVFGCMTLSKEKIKLKE